jgi:hydrophobic/amphiphilic exporter-1 (mainly G- bacteria), HAE1 family
VRDRVETVRALLPAERGSPVVQKFEIGALPIMNLALPGRRAPTRCSSWRTRTCASGSRGWTGVAGVQIVGGRAREVEVLYPPERLQAYGVTLPDIIG